MRRVDHMIKGERVSTVIADLRRERLDIRARCYEHTLEMTAPVQARENADAPDEYEYKRHRQVEEQIGLGCDTKYRDEEKEESGERDVDRLCIEQSRCQSIPKEPRMSAIETRDEKDNDPSHEEERERQQMLIKKRT
jgi:hypothetical protein